MFGLTNGITSFDENDYFDTNRYNNLFSTYIEFGRIDDAEKFINEYGRKLEPEEQNFWINFSMAEIKCKKGEYDKALKHLSMIRNIKVISYKLNLKALQLRVYYDSGLVEQAIAAADSFRHFLQKESLMNPVYNEQYRNFLSFYNKLPKLNSGKRSAEEIKNDLRDIKNIVFKNWLMERIAG